MLKLNILNMKNFLDTVNACTGKVNKICPDGRKLNINGEEKIQGSLWRQYFQNKNCLRLVLEIPNPTDYMNIVSYYAGWAHVLTGESPQSAWQWTAEAKGVHREVESELS